MPEPTVGQDQAMDLEMIRKSLASGEWFDTWGGDALAYLLAALDARSHELAEARARIDSMVTDAARTAESFGQRLHEADYRCGLTQEALEQTREALALTERRLSALRSMHVPKHYAVGGGSYCEHDTRAWPCPTVLALPPGGARRAGAVLTNGRGGARSTRL